MAAGAFGLGALVPGNASAALTSSEKAVVASFVEKAALDTAPRVRALVARPDLAPDEVAEPLVRGYGAAPFDDAHARFTEALLFGPGSAASRNTLVPAVVRALLRRAAVRMEELPVDATAEGGGRERAAAAEVLAIHAFIDSRVANAGTPPPDGHDPSAAIRDDALRAAVDLEKEHWLAHERWFRSMKPVSAELARVRVQAATAVVDLGRGVVGRHELADWLGLDGARAGLFERTGVLAFGSGAEPEARVADAVRWLEAAPHATDGLSVWLLDKSDPTGLVARGRIARTGVRLGSATRPLSPSRLWPAEVTPSRPDAALARVLRSVAELATARALATRPSLAATARAMAERAAGAGPTGYLSVEVLAEPLAGEAGVPAPPPGGEAVLASAVHLLLVDAPRALDLALIRAAAGRPQALEQFATALSVLTDGKRATLGRTRPDGSIEAIDATDVGATSDAATAFVLSGKHYAVYAGKAGAFVATVDGAPPRLTALSSYAVLTEAAGSWSVGNTTFERLYGEPRGAALDDGRFVLEGGRSGFDAVAAGAPSSDAEVTANVLPAGAGGAVLARAAAGDTSYSAITLFLETEPSRARLVFVDGSGRAVEIAPPVELPRAPAEGYPVSLRVAGDRVTAKVADKTLSGVLRREVAPGRVGLSARAEGRLEVRRFKVRAGR